MAEWISVKDRLPEDEKQVLVYDRIHKTCTIGNYKKTEENDYWVAYQGESSIWYNITHWMPLPEPPKGE